MAEDVSTGAPSAPDTPTPQPTAVEQAVAERDQAAYKAARLAEKAGTPLEPTKPVDAASTTPEQAASTEASSSPASEPGKPAGHKGNAETRKAELQAEIDSLLRQRAQLRGEVERDTRTRQAEPAKPASQPAADELPEPKLADFEADPVKYPDPYAAYVEARAEWKVEQRLRAREAEAHQRAEREQHAAEVETRSRAFDTRWKEVVTKDPSVATKVNRELVKDLRPVDVLAADEPRRRRNLIGQQVYESEHAVDLLLHLSDHPEDVERLENLPNPGAMAYELGRIVGQRQADAARRPHAKTVTDAPPPPPTVSTGGALPTDEEVAAVKAGDMGAFKAAKQRQRAALAGR